MIQEFICGSWLSELFIPSVDHRGEIEQLADVYWSLHAELVIERA
jgi:hypothetical protein